MLVSTLNGINAVGREVQVKVFFSKSKKKINRKPFSVRTKKQNPEWFLTKEKAIERGHALLRTLCAGMSLGIKQGTLRDAIDLFEQHQKKRYDEHKSIVASTCDQPCSQARRFIDKSEKVVKKEFVDLPADHWRPKRDGRYQLGTDGKPLTVSVPRYIDGEEIGSLKCHEIKSEDIERWIKFLSKEAHEQGRNPSGKEWSYKTKEAYRLALVGVFKLAQARDWCHYNPASNLKIEQAKYDENEQDIKDSLKKKKSFLKVSVFEQTLKIAEHNEPVINGVKWCYSLAVFFIAYTGVRFGELAALTWECLNLDYNSVHIQFAVRRERDGGYVVQRPKDTAEGTNFKNRHIILEPELVQKLREWKLRSPCSRNEDRVFPTFNGVFHKQSTAILKFWYDACDKAGNERVHFRSLRHYFATILFETYPKELDRIADQMGHTKLDTTRKIYKEYWDNKERDKEEAQNLGAVRARLANQ